MTIDLQKLINRSIKNAKQTYQYLAEGRNRIVFIKDEQWIVKVPKNEMGILNNQQEADRYKKFGKTKDIIAYAECRIEHDTNDIPLLIMEKISETIPDKDMPEWASYVDGNQVGLNSKGEIVAFDYADD